MAPVVAHVKNKTPGERCSIVVSALAFRAGGPWFESRQEHSEVFIQFSYLTPTGGERDDDAVDFTCFE